MQSVPRATNSRRRPRDWASRVIATEQNVTVEAAIDRVWNYVAAMQNWASIMPGFQDYAIIDEDDSRWTLKIGVGGLVRTVKVLVHVDQWDGPGRVLFSFKLEGDPVKGGGSYSAMAKSAGETEISLQVSVEGTGPMAPMWEAMGGPLLPKFALSFAKELKARIETEAGILPAEAESTMRRWIGKLRSKDGT